MSLVEKIQNKIKDAHITVSEKDSKLLFKWEEVVTVESLKERWQEYVDEIKANIEELSLSQAHVLAEGYRIYEKDSRKILDRLENIIKQRKLKCVREPDQLTMSFAEEYDKKRLEKLGDKELDKTVEEATRTLQSKVKDVWRTLGRVIFREIAEE
ncbi:MAG: hypothetical protein KIH08_04185 [Candidatus Freyarchaeota archaeon]|nr:hypothetical protein [Candidatus Jordarchaeia archaeon]MBS7267885.1 hypothetical protein [Candidatus Jordarchaeia archaeon]MBS7279048.1 hypothetical protein [Candidatus Jordarchaeia archaeon]